MDTRFVASARLELIIKIIQILMLGALFLYFALYSFYGGTLGTAPNVATGEIYPLNLHGHIVYLSRLQHRGLEGFGALTLFFGAIFASICAYLFYRQKKGRRVLHP
jgi:hypothetical protein